jgi:hypothetical protein
MPYTTFAVTKKFADTRMSSLPDGSQIHTSRNIFVVCESVNDDGSGTKATFGFAGADLDDAIIAKNAHVILTSFNLQEQKLAAITLASGIAPIPPDVDDKGLAFRKLQAALQVDSVVKAATASSDTAVQAALSDYTKSV